MIDIAKEIKKLQVPHEKMIIVSPRQFEELQSGNPSKETLAYFEWAREKFILSTRE